MLISRKNPLLSGYVGLLQLAYAIITAMNSNLDMNLRHRQVLKLVPLSRCCSKCMTHVHAT